MKDGSILLVEDNPDDETFILLALRKSGIMNSVIVMHDGLEALDYLTRNGDDIGKSISRIPLIVLLDLKLPKMGGLEFLRRMRKNEATRVIPVIVLTSSRDKTDIMNSYRFGANSFIHKPVDFEQFTQEIGQLGSYWLMLNEAPFYNL